MNAPDISRHLRPAPVVRPALATDAARVAEFLAAMDRDGLYERHFAHGDAPNRALLERLRLSGTAGRLTVLACSPTGAVVGHAEYVADAGAAEFALLVLPGWRDLGVGRALLQALHAAATAKGLHRLHGLVMATNTRAIALMKTAGYMTVPGDDRRTVVVSRRLNDLQASPDHGLDRIGAMPPEIRRHDPDRASLHRCVGA